MLSRISKQVKKIANFLRAKPTRQKPTPERMEELTEKLKYAAREIGETAAKISSDIPKEQQLTLDLGQRAKIVGGIMHFVENKESNAHITEVGRKDRSPYKIFEEGTINPRFQNTPVKRFNEKEQLKHTRIIKKDTNGITRLYDQNGKIYNTRNEVSKGRSLVRLHLL